MKKVKLYGSLKINYPDCHGQKILKMLYPLIRQDFFCAWLSEIDETLSENFLNPDINWSILYPIP